MELFIIPLINITAFIMQLPYEVYERNNTANNNVYTIIKHRTVQKEISNTEKNRAVSQASRRAVTWLSGHVTGARSVVIGRATDERSHIEWHEVKAVAQSVKRVWVSWFREWPWSSRVFCDNLVLPNPKRSVLIE